VEQSIRLEAEHELTIRLEASQLKPRTKSDIMQIERVSLEPRRHACRGKPSQILRKRAPPRNPERERSRRCGTEKVAARDVGRHGMFGLRRGGDVETTNAGLLRPVIYALRTGPQ
jgi:hypothetical protein